MENFRTLNGKQLPNIIEYIKNYLNERDDVEILLGADSQSFGRKKTIYGVVIALYTKGKGAHVICSKTTTKFEKDTSSRLMIEVWKAIEVAEFLKENGIKQISYIDVDLNPDPKFDSNKVFRQAVGMVEGMGYKVRSKQNGALMTYGANHLVRQ